jgi:hypothetical protein
MVEVCVAAGLENHKGSGTLTVSWVWPTHDVTTPSFNILYIRTVRYCLLQCRFIHKRVQMDRYYSKQLTAATARRSTMIIHTLSP